MNTTDALEPVRVWVADQIRTRVVGDDPDDKAAAIFEAPGPRWFADDRVIRRALAFLGEIADRSQLTLDPEFLKEDAKVVADTVLGAVQDAAKQAKDYNDAEMQKISSGFQMPGMF